MKTTLALISAVFTAFLSLPAVSATDLAAADCSNFGNVIRIAGNDACNGTTGCANYGVIVNIASAFGCGGGPCSNDGVLVNVASSYCGQDETLQVCSGSQCVDAPLSSSTQAASLRAADCIPAVEEGDFGTLHITCQSGGTACGIAQAPVCWTVRYACMNALAIVLRIYDGMGYRPEASDCEGQPGWASSPSSAAALAPASGCAYNFVGNCTGGYCTFNVGVCMDGGNCWLNAAGVCKNDCLANIASVCTRNCLVNVVGFCFKSVPILETETQEGY